MRERNTTIGLDVGAESMKFVEFEWRDGLCRMVRRRKIEHRNNIRASLRNLLSDVELSRVCHAAVTGRMGHRINLPMVPTYRAVSGGIRHLAGSDPLTVISIGARGSFIFERRADEAESFRTSTACSLGTGSSLSQLCGRIGHSVELASELCDDVVAPSVIVAQCPVVLQAGILSRVAENESPSGLLADLFDLVCVNAMALTRPGVTPSRVVLSGVIFRSKRIRRVLTRLLREQGMHVDEEVGDDANYLEAIGCALFESTTDAHVPRLDQWFRDERDGQPYELPAVRDTIRRVRRLCPVEPVVPAVDGLLVLGFDIGSFVSKVVAIEAGTARWLWEDSCPTDGRPLEAAKILLARFDAKHGDRCRVVSVGLTGNGGDAAESVMAATFGRHVSVVFDGITAQVEGALYHDAEVDTIIEIGGGHASYIRLHQGRVVDSVLGRACSAGFGRVGDKADRLCSSVADGEGLCSEAAVPFGGMSFGPCCDVLMDAVSAGDIVEGVNRRGPIADVFGAVVRNYLRCVKGDRAMGNVVICQGLPFVSDALAAEMARQTGLRIVIPPHPGATGALGSALVARRRIGGFVGMSHDLRQLTEACLQEECSGTRKSSSIRSLKVRRTCLRSPAGIGR